MQQYPRIGMLCLLLTFNGSGCASESKDDEHIKIGFLYSTEGFFGAFEPSFVDAARLAADIINDEGGTLDRKLEIIPKNFAGKVDAIEGLAKELKDDGVVAVIGPLVSPYSEALSNLPQEQKLPYFVLTSDQIFDDAPYVLNMLATQSDHATMLASRAIGAGQKSMAVIYEQTLARAEEVLEREYEARGGTIVSSVVLSIDDQADETLAQIMESPPDVITLLSTPALGAGVLNRFLQTYSAADVQWRFWPTLCIGDFALGVPGLGTLSHEIISTSFQSGASHEVFTELFSKRFPSSLLLGHSTFDSVFAIALAVEAAGASDSALVRAALPEVTRGGDRYDFLRFARARDAIRAGSDVDYAGTSHAFDYGDDGRLEQKSVEFVLCHYDESGKQSFGKKPFTLED